MLILSFKKIEQKTVGAEYSKRLKLHFTLVSKQRDTTLHIKTRSKVAWGSYEIGYLSMYNVQPIASMRRIKTLRS